MNYNTLLIAVIVILIIFLVYSLILMIYEAVIDSRLRKAGWKVLRKPGHYVAPNGTEINFGPSGNIKGATRGKSSGAYSADTDGIARPVRGYYPHRQPAYRNVPSTAQCNVYVYGPDNQPPIVHQAQAHASAPYRRYYNGRQNVAMDINLDRSNTEGKE